VTIQVYLAVIASLLVTLWTGRKPSKRTLEMLCWYLSGWASEEELLAQIEKRKKQPQSSHGHRLEVRRGGGRCAVVA